MCTNKCNFAFQAELLNPWMQRPQTPFQGSGARLATTGSLEAGKSPGAPHKTTPHQDRALLRMVWQDRVKSAGALTERMRNLYGVRSCHKTINNRLVAHGYRARSPLRKTPLTAYHRRMRLAWAQRWRNLTATQWQHTIFDDESRFQLYPVDGRMRVRRLPGDRFLEDCQMDRVQAGGGSIHVWGAFHNNAKSLLVPLDRNVNGAVYWDILRDTLVPFARQHFGENFRYQDDNATPHHCLPPARGHHQDATAIKIPWLQPYKAPLRQNGACSQQDGQSPTNSESASQALLANWTEIPVERLQGLVTSMPRRLASIIHARDGSTQYWFFSVVEHSCGKPTTKKHQHWPLYNEIGLSWIPNRKCWLFSSFPWFSQKLNMNDQYIKNIV